ncbi:thiosulfate oxidation carrier complex protein SoxZ [Thiohalomonas denitrificans]|uniref:Sulfur-oxidizing protein SoxZ n=1 Tax=Thiohalomonas denitrificans TaxID=415747 RepID=A0A1G5PZR2_9GAMM|nr:thiosulfate oxidation carrier complex protein SoxZ [Thiohalomonas denitrificans]SCZ54882.1 sulfur-oxidizing protein SoxZ [Thiohalomonas denitrificans]
MAGSIMIRANKNGELTTVKALIKHPMETGLRKDKKSGKKIPAHFIQEVSCKHAGKEVMSAQWGASVSKNPYFTFRFRGADKGDRVTLTWVDNQGGSESGEAEVA